MRTICWDSLETGDDAMHVAYVSHSERDSWRLHGHDFYELFWIDSGLGTQFYGEDGEGEMPLYAGLVSFVGPNHLHGLEAKAASEPFAFVNVAFPTAAWRELRDRYDLSEHPLFSEEGGVPPFSIIAREHVREVCELFRELVHAPRNELTRDCFLLSLARRTGGDLKLPNNIDMSAALRRALYSVSRDSELLRGGPASLAQEAGCSPSHLARTMKTTIGVTPSEWVLGERIRRAKRLLVATGLSIAEVALEAGFENLSHFHRRFREQVGETPLRFRKTRAKTVV